MVSSSPSFVLARLQDTVSSSDYLLPGFVIKVLGLSVNIFEIE